MKTVKFLLLLILFCAFISESSSQNQISAIKAGSYKAKKIKNESELPGEITITVTRLANGIDGFYDEKQKPLSGTYHLFLRGNTEHAIVELSKGLINGKAIRYWYSDISRVYEYKNGLLDGDVIWFYEPNKLREVSKYKNGIILSSIGYHQNGQIETEQQFDEKGLATGKQLVYDKEGNIVGERNYRNGLYNGTVMNITDNKKTVENYKDGVIDGKYAEYYANQKIKEEGVYLPEYKKDGVWKYWGENGNILEEKKYKKGKLEGEVITYYPSGVKQSVAQYADNKLNGKRTEYDENANVMNESIYVEGRLDGYSKSYNNGVLWRDCIYKEDELISEKEYKNGKLNVHRMVDDSGRLIDVRRYDNAGKTTYRNRTYKKPDSVKIVESVSGVIDIE